MILYIRCTICSFKQSQLCSRELHTTTTTNNNNNSINNNDDANDADDDNNYSYIKRNTEHEDNVI